MLANLEPNEVEREHLASCVAILVETTKRATLSCHMTQAALPGPGSSDTRKEHVLRRLMPDMEYWQRFFAKAAADLETHLREAKRASERKMRKMTEKEKDASRLGFGIAIKITEALNNGLGPLLEKARQIDTPETDEAFGFEVLGTLQSVRDNLFKAAADLTEVLDAANRPRTDLN